jgi:hemerythrin
LTKFEDNEDNNEASKKILDKSKLSNMPNIQEIEARREYDQSMLNEKLSGQVKSKWLLNHKYNVDQAVLKSLERYQAPASKRRTKGLF